MNKSNLTIMLFFSVLGLTFFTSCKGSAGKKAATETLEFIEKKAASKAAISGWASGTCDRGKCRRCLSLNKKQSSKPSEALFFLR